MRLLRITRSPLAGASLALLASGCARAPMFTAPSPTVAAPVASVSSTSAANAFSTGVGASPTVAAPCIECGVAPSESEVLRAVAARVADLKARGGTCSVYGGVLEESLATKRILVRPFMWRVGPHLASAQALSSGEIDVARDVDLLNLGRRTLDEVVRSLEHEAVHIAFSLPSGAVGNEGLVDARVNECSH